jgi:hypothetical protein
VFVQDNFSFAEKTRQQAAKNRFLQVSMDYVNLVLFAESRNCKESERVVFVVSQVDKCRFDGDSFRIRSQGADKGFDPFGVDPFGNVFDHERCAAVAKMIDYM